MKFYRHQPSNGYKSSCVVDVPCKKCGKRIIQAVRPDDQPVFVCEKCDGRMIRT
jgi:predicted nucleic acid-binding Zn ribbon protein